MRERWANSAKTVGVELLPDADSLEEFISVCYQASMLREEDRRVTFRAILAAPSLFANLGRPPRDLQRLDLSRLVPFTPTEVRRLSVAANLQRTLLGVQRSKDGGLRIWGLINSGAWWLRDIQGGRRPGPPLPPVPVVQAESPGDLAVFKGHELIGTLRQGIVSGSRLDLFESAWLPAHFAEFSQRLSEQHQSAMNIAQRAGEHWAPLEPSLPRRIAERMLKRVIAVLRDARHGGAIIFVPTENVAEVFGADPFIRLRYPFGAAQSALSFS